MVTRRDFNAVAEAVKEVRNARDRTALAISLANYFAGQNHRFDRDRFYAACQVHAGLIHRGMAYDSLRE